MLTRFHFEVIPIGTAKMTASVVAVTLYAATLLAFGLGYAVVFFTGWLSGLAQMTFAKFPDLMNSNVLVTVTITQPISL